MTIKTREQIALEYGVCRKTLRKWMATTEYGFPRHLTLAWQKLIYEEFGYPMEVKEEAYERIKLPRPYRQLASK
jgi:transposase-like protein